jgi:transcriptional regulator with XRE-family HTH domain
MSQPPAGVASARPPKRLDRRQIQCAVAQQVLRTRLAAGLTQEALAKRLRRSQSWISVVEHGTRKMRVSEFVAIAQALDADPGALLAAALRAVSSGVVPEPALPSATHSPRASR